MPVSLIGNNSFFLTIFYLSKTENPAQNVIPYQKIKTLNLTLLNRLFKLDNKIKKGGMKDG
jgi:hypothetical protein